MVDGGRQAQVALRLVADAQPRHVVLVAALCELLVEPAVAGVKLDAVKVVRQARDDAVFTIAAVGARFWLVGVLGMVKQRCVQAARLVAQATAHHASELAVLK
ncbi:hypothetical protein D3C72_1963800 [compost metagenome]